MEIVKKAAALADEAQQSTACMMVLLVRRQVTGELLDARRKYSNLNFGGAAVIGGAGVRLYYFPFLGARKRHLEFLLSLFLYC
jgi:hypothetical protein